MSRFEEVSASRRGAVLSWTGWCAERERAGGEDPAWAKRRPPPDSDTPVRSKLAVDLLIASRDVHLREKTLWKMLCETVSPFGWDAPVAPARLLTGRLLNGVSGPVFVTSPPSGPARCSRATSARTPGPR